MRDLSRPSPVALTKCSQQTVFRRDAQRCNTKITFAATNYTLSVSRLRARKAASDSYLRRYPYIRLRHRKAFACQPT